MTPTPPPMSDADIRMAMTGSPTGYVTETVRAICRDFEKMRDEQWRQRLEVVAAIDGAGIPHTLIEGEDLGPQDTPLYRTKEQVQCNAKN